MVTMKLVNLTVGLSDTESMKQVIRLLAIAAIWTALLSGCDADLTGTGKPLDNYRVETVLLANLDTSTTSILLTLTKNGLTYKKADIALSGKSLDTTAAGYYRLFDSSEVVPDSVYILSIKDSTTYTVNLSLTLPGVFSINETGVRFYSGTAETVSWTLSEETDGYILATTPPDSAITDEGYEIYAGGTTGTLPPDAFIYNDERIIGDHLIYVASYTGAPTSFPDIPFDIPAENYPADNVSGTQISGRVAGMVIAVPDTIIVTTTQ